MPKVQLYQAQKLPEVQYDRTAGMVGRSIQEASVIADKTVRAFEQNQMLTQLNEGQAQYLEGLNELSKKYEEDTDYFSLEERVGKDVEDLKKQVLKSTPDRRVAKELGYAFDEQAMKFMGTVRTAARKGQVATGQAKTDAVIEQYAKAFAAADPEGREYYRQRIEETLQAAESSGLWYPDDIETKRQQIDSGLTRAEIFADIDRVGLEETYSAVKAGKYDIMPEMKFELERELRGEINSRKAEAKKRAKGAYDVSNPDTVAAVSNAIYNSAGPQATQEDLDKLHGNGLSTKDYEHFSEQLDQEIQKEGGPGTYAARIVFGQIEKMFPGNEKYAAKVKGWVSDAIADKQKEKEKLGTGKLTIKDVEEVTDDIMNHEKKKAIRKLIEKNWKKQEKSVLAELPPAEEHEGEIFEDTETGLRYKSNGNEWIEVQ